MGNVYTMICFSCNEYLRLGKEAEWRASKRTCYILESFLGHHTPGHNLGYSGDQWNRDGRFTDHLQDFFEWDSHAAEQDYLEEIEANE